MQDLAQLVADGEEDFAQLMCVIIFCPHVACRLKLMTMKLGTNTHRDLSQHPPVWRLSLAIVHLLWQLPKVSA